MIAAAAPAWAEPLHLVAFGDSLTQGYGLPPEDGFVAQLQAWLSAQGQEVTVLNAGVSGDTTAGGLARIGWTLTPQVDAMIVALGGNDALRGLPPEATRENLAGILAEAQARHLPVLLVGISVPGNFGAEYQTEFEAIYPALAAQYEAQLYRDFLAPLAEQLDRDAALRRYMQADGIHPNAEGVKLIVEAMGPAVISVLERARPGAEDAPAPDSE